MFRCPNAGLVSLAGGEIRAKRQLCPTRFWGRCAGTAAKVGPALPRCPNFHPNERRDVRLSECRPRLTRRGEDQGKAAAWPHQIRVPMRPFWLDRLAGACPREMGKDEFHECLIEERDLQPGDGRGTCGARPSGFSSGTRGTRPSEIMLFLSRVSRQTRPACSRRQKAYYC